MITLENFDINKYDDAVIVTDAFLSETYNIKGANVLLLPRGEEAKSFACIERLCKSFLKLNLQKDGKVVAVGGGSLTDAAGFAVSVYKRGVRFVSVPTTLLGQVDAGIGGKTALDLGGVKNIVGSFVKGDVLIDFRFLATLHEVQIADGFAEIEKYRFLNAETDSLERNNEPWKYVEPCAKFKESVCARDPYDENERRILNLGHTFGHALESRYKVSHGHALYNGLYYETALACRLGVCSKDFFARRKQFLKHDLVLNEAVTKLTYADKKNRNGKIAFVLTDGNYNTVNVELEKSELLDLTEKLC